MYYIIWDTCTYLWLDLQKHAFNFQILVCWILILIYIAKCIRSFQGYSPTKYQQQKNRLLCKALGKYITKTLINEVNRYVATSHDLCNMSEVVCHHKWSFDVAFKLRVISHAEASSKSVKLDDWNGMHNSYIHCLHSKFFLPRTGVHTPPYTHDSLL